MRVRFRLPPTQTQPAAAPGACPHCAHRHLHPHAREERTVKDLRVEQVQVQRWRCEGCGRTFRHYPQGVSASQQSAALKGLSVLLWVLGLSYDNVCATLARARLRDCQGHGVGNVQQAGASAQQLRHCRPKGQVRVVGVDLTEYKVKGQPITVGYLTDAQCGAVLEVELLAGAEAQHLLRWLKQTVRQLGVEGPVSDDADAFKEVADRLELKQQLCVAHVRKGVTQRTKELSELAPQLEQGPRSRGDPQELIADCERVRALVKQAMPEGEAALGELHHKYQWAKPPPKGAKASLWYRMRLLTLRLWENWQRLTFFRTPAGKGLDGTNNVTERAIGRCGKIRYKSMRGYKSRVSWKRTMELFAWLGEADNGYRLAEVVG